MTDYIKDKIPHTLIHLDVLLNQCMDTCEIKHNSDSKQPNGIYQISLKGHIGGKTSDDIPVANNSNKYIVNEDPRIFEPPDKKKARWRSIRIMYLTMFLSSVTFTITMASLWPYLELVDREASADFFGWIVAGYSIGQLVASPLFGFWSNRFNTTRWPLLLSIGINIIANIMYAYIESFPDTRQYYLLLARGLVGFGAGNVAVVRSYVAGATTNEERTGVMANVSICQSVGFILGPAFQAALVPLGYPGPISKLEFHLDLYTAPAFLSAIAGFINILLLVTLFKETRVTELTTLSVQGDDSESMNVNYENKPDYFAVICSIMIFFVVLFIFTIFETIGSPLTMDMYGWSKKKATLYQGIILVGAGCEAIVVSLLLKRIAKRFSERILLIFGFFVCLCGYFIFLPWGHELPIRAVATLNPSSNVTISIDLNSVTPEYILKNISTGNDWADVNSTSTQVPMVTNVTTTVEPEGCPEYYDWCSYTPVVYFQQYLAGVACIGVGYPIAQIMSYTLYSKILGPMPQAVWMGWLTAAGSAARAVGPVFVTQIYDGYGPRVTFSACCGVLVVALIGMGIVYKRLVPLETTATVLASPIQNGHRPPSA